MGVKDANYAVHAGGVQQLANGRAVACHRNRAALFFDATYPTDQRAQGG